MRSFNRLLLPALLLSLAVPYARAQDPIRFARTPDLSPDGKLIAFSYLGDIYTVETIGGTARPITSHPAHDVGPVFSPDGQHIAFSSNRHGSYDVFVVSARGGRPKRLTYDSASDMVSGWSPDGKSVLFSSHRGMDFPHNSGLYLVPMDGGRVTKLSAADGKEGSFSPKGDQLAYTTGPGEWYRKGYRGSSNDDVWLANADGTNNRRLTTFNGQDHSPMWSPEGDSLYYVSEVYGIANVVRQPITGSLSASKPTQLTHHADDSVRKARVSRNGEWIVYECGPDVWVVSTKEGAKPRKVAIEVNADDKANNERVVTFTNRATEFQVSPDEKQVAFAVQGKLFRMPLGQGTGRPVQMTHGASNDHGMAFSPDGSKLLFLSDRGGHDDLYVLEQDDPDHPRFADAHRYKVTRLTDSRDAESGVTYSPDGKKIAFLRGGKLWAMNPDGKEQKPVINDVQVFDYDWSPDSRWLVFARRDGSFASELYIAPSTGPTVSNPVRNITRYATYNGGVSWSADGKRLAFLSDRRGAANLHVLDLEKPVATSLITPAAPRPTLGLTWGARPPLAIDWEDIHLRAVNIVRGLVDDALISPDGTKVAFRDAIGRDLWVANSTGSMVMRLTTGGLNPRQIQWSKQRGLLAGPSDKIYFLDALGQIRAASASSGASIFGGGGGAVIPFKLKMNVRQDELFTEMFDQSWRYLSENFYDEKFHGSNWDDVRKRYRPLVSHIAMKEDLYAMLYLMLGELNASHLGISGFIAAPEENTAELGLIWDETYKGKGLKIAEILKRGLADKKNIGLKAGEYIVAIDGTELSDKTNVSRLLNGKVGEPVIVQVTDNPTDPKAKRRRVELTGMNRYKGWSDQTSVSDLMYDRWIAKNAAKVSELSGGKLGYIHIPSMDEDGLDQFVRSLYSDNYDKEGIVLDVRFNGGGFTHDQVLNYLGSREHTIFRNRDGGQGLVLRSSDRKWHKPLSLLINNQSYSDAEIFPNAFKTLGLGKVVGQPTGGYVIGTGGVRLIDGSTFRIPRIGVYTTKGVNMEKEGVQPDVLVENHPDQLARGNDKQLAKAVQVLQTDVIAWKKKRTPEVVVVPPPPAGDKGVTPVSTPPMGTRP